MPGDGSVLLLLSGLLCLPLLVPDGLANRHGSWLRAAVTALAGAQALLAVLSLVASSLDSSLQRGPIGLFTQFSFQYDGTSALMIALVSFIGWVTCQYSTRYLDGESQQGRYFRWMSFTVGAVGAMVLAADLMTFGLLWCLTSFGLHHLLVHYGDRPAAQRAAWTKFIVSRIGDVAMLMAICLYYPAVGSLQFADLAVAAMDPAIASLPTFQLATTALAFAVLTKSAQLPFHTWLPLTMETPTPVSALMHAGIVNAGGYLLVRSNPLLSASFTAQLLLVIVGTVTACLASVIMVTQTSIKKKLAYSTISQMGFMLMQCGLGAYSAAMLHIIAHSLYKAHEFLSSGSVMARRAATQTASVQRKPPNWSGMVATMCALMVWAWLMLLAVGQDPITKAGGWLLTGLLCAGLACWLFEVMSVAQPRLALRAWLTAAVLIAAYAVSFSLVDASVYHQFAPTSPAWPLLLIAGLAFTALFLFQVALMSPRALHQLRFWQIHAANGFYIESWLRRSVRALKS